MNQSEPTWTRFLMRSVSIAALMISGIAAQAQQTENSNDEDEKEDEFVLEEIIVTGNVSVIASPGEFKQDSAAIVDGISQLQIDRLPDTSIAEVLTRVVGVSADQGFNTSQPRTVSVRGFDSRYNSTSIDGNPIWNSSRNNRGTQLDVFPSSVVSAVNVYKSVTPEYDANSVGGHIELRTLRAFDGGTQSYFTAQASYGLYEQDDVPFNGDASFRADLAGKFTFGSDNQFGVVYGVDIQQQQFTDIFNDIRGNNENAQGIQTIEGNVNYNGRNQSAVKRQAYYGKLEARATDALYAFASLSYYTEANRNTFNRSGLFIRNGSVTNATPTSGDFTRAAAIVFQEPFRIDRDTFLFSGGADYRTGDLSSLTLRVGYVDYNHDEQFDRSTQFRAFNNFAGSYDISGNQIRFNLTPESQAVFNDPSNFIGRTGRTRNFNFIIPHRDKVYSVRAQYNYNTHATSEGLGFNAGVNFRRLVRRFDQTFVGFGTPGDLTLNQVPANTASVASPGNIPIYFVDFNTIGTRRTGETFVDNALTSDYNLRENVWAGHAAGIYDFGQFRILAGFRVEHTEYTNDTAFRISGTDTPRTIKHSYTDFLPNVQAVYDVNDNWKVRASWTKTLARPDFRDFAFGQSTTVQTPEDPALPDVTVVNGTNPFLNARVSSNFDLSAEYYYDGGYFALGAFYKDFKNEIFTQRVETRDTNGNLTRINTTPLNNSDASVKGFEITWEHESFDFLPGALSGLGFAGNFTYLKGKWNVVFQDGSTRNPGGLRNQPSWIANLSLFYNYEKFSANLGWNLRGKTFTGRFGAVNRPQDDRFISNFNRLDLQASYQLTDNFRIFAEAKNLTNTFFRGQFRSGRLSNSFNPGRLFWIGFKYDL